MKGKSVFCIILVTLISASLGCSFSLDLGQATATPTLPASPHPTAVASVTPVLQTDMTVSATPDIPAATAPAPTPLPPPEIISTANHDRLVYNRAFGVGALVKILPSPDGSFALLVYTTRLVLLRISDLSTVWTVDPNVCLRDAAFSPDSKKIIALGIGGSVRVFDTAAGSLLAKPVSELKGLSFLALSPGGNWAAYTDFKGTTVVADAGSGNIISTNNGQAYPGGVSGMMLSPDEQTLIILGIDSVLQNQVQQWDISSGKFKIGLVSLPPQMTGWKFSPDGKRLYGVNPRSLTAEPSTVLLAWNTANGKLEKSFPKDDLIFNYLPSPDGKSILIAKKDGGLKLIDSQTGVAAGSFTGHTTDIDGMAFLPDGQTVLSISVDGKMILWDTFTRKVLLQVDGYAGVSYIPPAFATGSNHLILTNPNGKLVGVIAGDSWQPEQKFGTGDTRFNSIAISSQGTYAAAVDITNHIHIWKVSDGREIQTIGAITRAPIKKLIFSPDEIFISSLSEGQILTWDVTSGSRIRDLAGSNAFDYSPDGAVIASDSSDFNLYQAELKTGKMKAVIPGDFITAVRYSPDGRMIMVGAQKIQPKERGQLNLIYQVDTQTQKRTSLVLRDLPSLVVDMAYSPSGDLLASTDWQGNVIVWNLRDGKPLNFFEEIVLPPASLKFNSEGTLLYVIGGDSAIGTLSTRPPEAVAQAPNGQVPTSTEQPVPAGAPAAAAIKLEAFSHSKGLLQINLPEGWQVVEKDCSINVIDPNSKGGIAFSAIKTFSPLTADMFTALVAGDEIDFADSVEGYSEISKIINGEKGTALVTKNVQVDGQDYIWETDYVREDLIVYQINFLTPAASAAAMDATYSQITDSIQVNKQYMLKQMPYGVTKTFSDPGGSFSFEIPLGWTVSTQAQLDTTPKIVTNIYTSPEGDTTLTSITVEAGKTWDAAAAKSVLESFPKGLDQNIKVTQLAKGVNYDDMIGYESGQNIKGVGIYTNFGTKAHFLYLTYWPARIKDIASLQDYIFASLKK
jgi:WD40 repeat protein